MHEPIDSRQLQVFLSLASKGSLKAAAAELFLTSSAISHSITNLERNLGVRLFHRSGKGLLLTEKGRHLVKESVGILARMQSLRRTLAGDDLNEAGHLRVAAGHNFVVQYVPDVAREFSECFPRLKLHVRASERDACLAMLTAQEIDVAILVDPPNDGPDFVYQRLFQDELRVVLPARNPLAKLEVLPAASLEGRTLLVTRRQSYTTRRALEQLQSAGVDVRDCVEVGGTGAVLEMTKAGLGLGLLPDWILDRTAPCASLVTRSLADVKLRRVWGYVRPRWAQPGLADRTLLRLCRRAVELSVGLRNLLCVAGVALAEQNAELAGWIA